MKTIKEQLESLPSEQLAQLMVAFNHEVAQHILLPDGRFIGVNVGTIQGLEVEQQAGVWAVGKVKGVSHAP